ncbi:MAG: DUF3494 domain-containing protein [Aromatoleum sp.]|nr:DUF3494 domain-containing protein [Aromatoleum sp.]
MNAMKLAVPLFVALAYGPSPALAGPILGANLASFAVLGATGVTNVPVSTIGGNLGSAPNPSVGGGYIFTSGSLQQNTAIAQAAQIELDAAILAVNGTGPGLTIGSDLTGTIFPGTYTVPAAATNLSGALILDGGGNANAVWNFLFPTTLITSTFSTVTMINVGSGAGVGLYWSVGTGATLNGPTFAGNVLANTIDSSNGDLTITCGRLLSAEAQVTLIHDRVSIGCAGIGLGSGGFDQGVAIGSGGTGGSGGQIVNGVPEPGTFLLVGLGLAGLFASRKRLFPGA